MYRQSGYFSDKKETIFLITVMVYYTVTKQYVPFDPDALTTGLFRTTFNMCAMISPSLRSLVTFLFTQKLQVTLNTSRC